ncbi:YihY/virulence factor BrkB family protein [Halobium salinum]|uniref:YihY/virulence factor BrkB family protein n=1 Tax=Halobium salinum TaxID=1364940 RepID=A0ABD5P940_9EURY|nr:YihY/virulence factor BrkB family protein [Halobium salinum]
MNPSPRVERALEVGRAVVFEARAEKVTFLAGSVAYHAFVSLLPLFVLVLTVVSTVGSEPLQAQFLDVVAAMVTPGARDLLLAELESADSGLTLVGGALLVWGTLRIFRGLDTAFSDVYETEAENTFADQLVDGVVVLVTFAFAIVLASVLQSMLPAGDGLLPWLLRRLGLAVGLTLTFLPMFYIFPDTELSVVEVLPGALFTGAGLTALESLFRVYVATRDPGSSAIAGILVLLTWLYVSGLVLLLGVVVNAVLTNRSADVNIEPVIGTHRPTPEPDRADRAMLVRSLGDLDGLLGRGRALTVSVDGESVTLPPPQRVATDTDSALDGVGDPGLGLELRWVPRDDRGRRSSERSPSE